MNTLRSLFVALLFAAVMYAAPPLYVENVRVHTSAQVALNGGANGGVVTGASVTTGTTPSIITTAGNHNLATGDQVQISGIVGTTTDNVTAWVNVLSPTTFAIYNNPDLASTHGIIGTGTYSSGGYVSEATDVSGVTLGAWLLRLKVESLTAGATVSIAVEDSTDGFVSDIKTLAVFSVNGAVTANAPIEKTFLPYQIPNARIGVANGRVRVRIQSLSALASVTTSLLIQ